MSSPRLSAALTRPEPVRGLGSALGSAQGSGLGGLGRGLLALAASPLLWIPQAALLAGVIQRLTEGNGASALASSALAFVVLGVVRASTEAWGARHVFVEARERLSLIRAEAGRALAERSPLDRTRPASGEAAATLVEQADAVLPWLTRYQPARWRVMVVPPVLAIAVASQSWLAALILVLSAPLIPLFMAIIGWRAKAASDAQVRALGGMNGFLLDRRRGLSTLRALGAVDATALRLRASAEALRASTMRVLRIAFLSSAALELFSALAVALVAVYIGFHLLGQVAPGNWGRRLSLGQGLFILLLSPAFFEPLRDLSAAWHDRVAGQAALDGLERLRSAGMPLPGALAEPGQNLVAGIPAGQRGMPPAVEIRGLRYGYTGEAGLLQSFDLDIAPGEHVALLGTSGAGKSTLLALIAGLLPAISGEVRIGGIRLDEQHATALRQRIGWIGQRPHVFAGTVRDNVSLRRPEVVGADVAAAIDRASLSGVCNAAPSELLGEGGAGLSGGELVRLALARAAVAPGADLLLVDEPTAHLDHQTATSVTNALLRLAQGRTLIVATHDLALAARIGRVIRLDETPAQAQAQNHDHDHGHDQQERTAA